MKFAPIIPPIYDPAKITDLHLVLAHRVVQEYDYYGLYYRDLPVGHTVILDNGVVELGEPSFAFLRAAAALLRDDCDSLIVVVPDHLGDTVNTLIAARRFFAREEGTWRESRLMLVPHGGSLDGWLKCLDDLLRLVPPSKLRDLVIGLPRVVEDVHSGGRAALRGLLNEQGLWKAPFQFHLLGIQHNLQELAPFRFDPLVLGVDSSLPLRAASVSLRPRDVVSLRELPDEPLEVYPSEAEVFRAVEDIQFFLEDRRPAMPPRAAGGDPHLEPL